MRTIRGPRPGREDVRVPALAPLFVRPFAYLFLVDTCISKRNRRKQIRLSKYQASRRPGRDGHGLGVPCGLSTRLDVIGHTARSPFRCHVHRGRLPRIPPRSTIRIEVRWRRRYGPRGAVGGRGRRPWGIERIGSIPLGPCKEGGERGTTQHRCIAKLSRCSWCVLRSDRWLRGSIQLVFAPIILGGSKWYV